MKQIIIYGTGVNCDTFVRHAKNIDFEIMAYADKNKAGLQYEDKIIISPTDIKRFYFDEIFLTIGEATQEIRTWLIEGIGIPDYKIICPYELNKRYMLQGVSGVKYNFIMQRTPQFEILYKDIYAFDSVNVCGLLLCDAKWEIDDDESVEVVNPESVFFVLFMYGMNEKFLLYLKQKYIGIKSVLLLNDMIGGEYGYENVFPEFSIEKLKENADMLVTYHKAEADKYNLLYYMQSFTKLEIRSDGTQSDLFFVGNAKNRLDFLHAIYRLVTDAGGKCAFWILGVCEEKQLQSHDGIIYNQRLSYEDYLAKMYGSKCILEAVQDGDAASVRYCEAVAYNKKLLVNDASCKEYNFFNENYVKIIDSPEDIDVNWIMDKQRVDYGYSDEFSPKYMVNEVCKLLKY